MVNPKWDSYYMNIAKAVAENSSCLSRKIGSILVRDNVIIATGYNGPSRHVPHCCYRKDNGYYMRTEDFRGQLLELIPETKCPRQRMGYKSGQGLGWCAAAHSESNSIVNAAVAGHSTVDSTLYCNCPVPCIQCSKLIINARIKEVVCLSLEEYPQAMSSLEMFNYAGVVVRALDG